MVEITPKTRPATSIVVIDNSDIRLYSWKFSGQEESRLFYIYGVLTKSIRDQHKAEAEHCGVQDDTAVRTCTRCATRALLAQELTN